MIEKYCYNFSVLVWSGPKADAGLQYPSAPRYAAGSIAVNSAAELAAGRRRQSMEQTY